MSPARSSIARHVLAPVLILAAAACGQGPSATPEVPPPSAPAPPRTLKIMPLGDSITQGNTELDSYRRPLWARLQSEGRSVDFVGSHAVNFGGPPPHPDFDLDNEGHWGWTADEVLAEIDGWAQASRPDIVLMHLGTNDMLGGAGIGSTLDELEQIVARLRAANPDVAILMAQLIPADRPGRAERIVEMNANLPALASRLHTARSPVLLVDQFTGFDPASMSADGLHPNDVGERRMADVWHQALAPLLASRVR